MVYGHIRSIMPAISLFCKLQLCPGIVSISENYLVPTPLCQSTLSPETITCEFLPQNSFVTVSILQIKIYDSNHDLCI